jgi:hypothetical protein
MNIFTIVGSADDNLLLGKYLIDDGVFSRSRSESCCFDGHYDFSAYYKESCDLDVNDVIEMTREVDGTNLYGPLPRPSAMNLRIDGQTDEFVDRENEHDEDKIGCNYEKDHDNEYISNDSDSINNKEIKDNKVSIDRLYELLIRVITGQDNKVKYESKMNLNLPVQEGDNGAGGMISERSFYSESDDSSMNDMYFDYANSEGNRARVYYKHDINMHVVYCLFFKFYSKQIYTIICSESETTSPQQS